MTKLYDTEPKFYTIDTLAVELMVSSRTIERLLEHGKLPAFKVGGQVRISRDDLDKYIAANRRQPRVAPLPSG